MHGVFKLMVLAPCEFYLITPTLIYDVSTKLHACTMSSVCNLDTNINSFFSKICKLVLKSSKLSMWYSSIVVHCENWISLPTLPYIIQYQKWMLVSKLHQQSKCEQIYAIFKIALVVVLKPILLKILSVVITRRLTTVFM